MAQLAGRTYNLTLYTGVMDPKFKFLVNESRDDFKQKREEFEAYVEQTGISGSEIMDNLYFSCETPLRKKIFPSNRIHGSLPKDIQPKALMMETEKLYTPKGNAT